MIEITFKPSSHNLIRTSPIFSWKYCRNERPDCFGLRQRVRLTQLWAPISVGAVEGAHSDGRAVHKHRVRGAAVATSKNATSLSWLLVPLHTGYPELPQFALWRLHTAADRTTANSCGLWKPACPRSSGRAVLVISRLCSARLINMKSGYSMRCAHASEDPCTSRSSDSLVGTG